jgi:hypothetical protein
VRVPPQTKRLDYKGVNAAALPHLVSLCRAWLPEGVIRGHEYLALNPTRNDRHIGSFAINLRTGRWADFATNDQGGDVISYLAYLEGVSQSDACRQIARQLGLNQ